MPAKEKTKMATDEMTLVVLAGNPNSGKSTIFNNLTGSRQHIGNWPGVTVEKKEGILESSGGPLRLVDLPGTYSLGAYSEDEAVARNCILFDNPDVALNVVDATNLERNLYLTIQLLEMGTPVVIALNMADELLQKGMSVDADALSHLLGVPVSSTVATKKQGMEQLVESALSIARQEHRIAFRVDYGRETEAELDIISDAIRALPNLRTQANPRWLALKVLEGDDSVIEAVFPAEERELMTSLRTEALEHLAKTLDDDVESHIADRRYAAIGGIVRRVLSGRKEETDAALTISDKIDRVVTNRYLGIPLFLLAMWGMFAFTFKVGKPIADHVGSLFEFFGEAMGRYLASVNAPEIISSLFVQGIIGGLGSVFTFAPQIMALFLVISLLEDSGYMARAAYVVDRFMHALGLHGKSFIPLLIGFGCNVPAIMATRTLESKRDRLLTILINPLMSCSARLPVYVLFAGALFPDAQGLVVFSLYLLGMALALLMALVFRKTLFKGDAPPPFVMELPPYRVPTLKTTATHMWDRAGSFIKKAGTIIVSVTILVWALSSLPVGIEYASRNSFLGRLGGAVAPVFKPAGFGIWQAAVALVFGFVAKEVVVSTLGVVYGVGGGSLTATIAATWTPLSAYSFMAMTLIYIPCVAAMAAIKRETGSWRWTAFSAGYTLVLGWSVSVAIFQIGRLFGLR